MAADLGVRALIAPENGLSYVRGATDVPLLEATIGRFLRDTAERFPERPAVVFREQQVRWTWREFAAEIDVLAAASRRSAFARATASASGRRTAANGCSRSSRPHASARSS